MCCVLIESVGVDGDVLGVGDAGIYNIKSDKMEVDGR